ncbi:MAG: hypothetical protein VX423_05340 [Pseudomonadota bacterium]|nr:hypothetical protein [Pseudomonadota bacterium]
MKSHITTYEGFKSPMTIEEVFEIRKEYNKNKDYPVKNWTKSMQETASLIVRQKIQSLIDAEKWEQARRVSFGAMHAMVHFSHTHQSRRLISMEAYKRLSRYILKSLSMKDIRKSKSIAFGTTRHLILDGQMVRAYAPEVVQEMKEKGVTQVSHDGIDYVLRPKKGYWMHSIVYLLPKEIRYGLKGRCMEYRTCDIIAYLPIKYRKAPIVSYYVK